MKALKKVWFVALLCVLACGIFVACSDDDDPVANVVSSTPVAFTGTIEVTAGEGDAEGEKTIYTLTAYNNTEKQWIISMPSEEVTPIVANGTWKTYEAPSDSARAETTADGEESTKTDDTTGPLKVTDPTHTLTILKVMSVPAEEDEESENVRVALTTQGLNYVDPAKGTEPVDIKVEDNEIKDDNSKTAVLNEVYKAMGLDPSAAE